jgi:hypothetical protein
MASVPGSSRERRGGLGLPDRNRPGDVEQRFMRRVLAVAVLVTLAVAVAVAVAGAGAGAGAATAVPEPDVSVCAAAQLQVSVSGTPMHLQYDDKKRQPTYFTNVNVFVVNVGPGACYLLGAPVVTLRAEGRDVGAPYSHDSTEVSAGDVLTPTALALGPLLLPYPASHQYAELNGAWNAPYCGKPVRAAATVTSVTSGWTAMGHVPSPPCRGNRRSAGTTTSGWSILTGK